MVNRKSKIVYKFNALASYPQRSWFLSVLGHILRVEWSREIPHEYLALSLSPWTIKTLCSIYGSLLDKLVAQQVKN